LKRIGHKGAAAAVTGNTLESFGAAAEAGVDMIELDVLWLRDGHTKLPAAERSPLVIAHDWRDAEARPRLTLAEALDAFTRPPLDRVEIDCDLKLRGRETELHDALRERDLLGRAMVSTMEVPSLVELRRLSAELRLGWTVPKSRRDWPSIRWARPLLYAGIGSLRARLPGIVRRRAPRLGVQAIWAYQHVITRRLADTAHTAGIELYAWTVDDLSRMQALKTLGVDGICSNDPRLFAELRT